MYKAVTSSKSLSTWQCIKFIFKLFFYLVSSLMTVIMFLSNYANRVAMVHGIIDLLHAIIFKLLCSNIIYICHWTFVSHCCKESGFIIWIVHIIPCEKHLISREQQIPYSIYTKIIGNILSLLSLGSEKFHFLNGRK